MIGLFPNSLFTIHQGHNNARGLSGRLWSRVNGQHLSPDGFSNGFFVGDDFRTFGDTYAVASNVGRYASEAGAYRSYEDTGDAITQLATERTGVVKIAVAATNNNETWIQPGHATSVMSCIDDTAGSDKLLIFEARVKAGQVSTTSNIFVGLSEEGLAAADTAADSGGAMASKDFIGFFLGEADGTSLKFVYRKAGQAMQTVLTYGTAIAADTWYKLGFVYDPSKPAANRIAIFVDNVEQSTYVTATNIAAATFPDGEELNFLWGCKNNNAAVTTQCDFWALYQGG